MLAPSAVAGPSEGVTGSLGDAYCEGELADQPAIGVWVENGTETPVSFNVTIDGESASGWPQTLTSAAGGTWALLGDHDAGTSLTIWLLAEGTELDVKTVTVPDCATGGANIAVDIGTAFCDVGAAVQPVTFTNGSQETDRIRVTLSSDYGDTTLVSTDVLPTGSTTTLNVAIPSNWPADATVGVSAYFGDENRATLLLEDDRTVPDCEQPGDPHPLTAAAELPEVVMICNDGQIDINHASTDELMDSLDLSRPVADRLVDYRPYLGPRDLGVVEGIGPDRLQEILDNGVACATPPSLPPPATEYCDAPGLIDLQSARLDDITGQLDVPRPVAQRIIDARPFAQLAHVVPERVPGVGKGTLSRLSEVSCLTPAPIRTALTSWRWVYRDVTTKVERDQFALRVPAGALDPMGAWASITPVDSTGTALEGPAADFHIYGDWTGSVRVTTPTDPDLDELPADYFEPVMTHVTGGEQLFIHGAMLDLSSDRSTQSANVPSLSVLGGSAIASWLMAPFKTISVVPNERGVLLEAVGQLTGTTGSQPDCSPDWSSNARITSAGGAFEYDNILDRTYTYHCVTAGNQLDEARWKLSNNTGVPLHVVVTGGSTVDIVNVTATGNLFTDTAYKEWNQTPADPGRARVDLPPGAEVWIDAKPPTVGQEVTFDASEWTVLPATISRLFDQALPSGELTELYDGVANCGWGASVMLNQSEAVVAGLDTVLDCAAFLGDALGESAQKAVQSALVMVDAASTGVNFISNLPVRHSAYLTVREPKPTTTPAGGLIHPSCTYWSPDGTSGYDEACQASFEQSLGESSSPPDDSGCWRFDVLAGTWVLDASAGQQCLLIDSGPSTGGPGEDGDYYNDGPVFCGVGTCVTLPEGANRIIELSDGRSFYLQADGSAWHLATADAYFSCGGYDARLYNHAWDSWKWGFTNLARFTVRGDITSCPVGS